MGDHDILSTNSGSSSHDQAPADPHRGYAGPVPGKRTLTAGIPSRRKDADSGTAVLSDQALHYIEHGGDFNPEGALWDDSPESNEKRKRLREVILLRLPLYFGDADVAIERVMLKVTLTNAPPNVALAIVGLLCDQLSGHFIGWLTAVTKTLGTAAELAKGISEASGQAVPALVSIIREVKPKYVEAAAKKLTSFVKGKIEGDVKGMASQGFNAQKAENLGFLKGVQGGFRIAQEQYIAVYLGGTDMDKLALAAMLENRPSLEQLEANFLDLVERYAREQISDIGKKKDGITEAKYRLVRVEAYGEEVYLNVLTAEGSRVGAKPRMVGTGGQNKDIIDPDKSAELVAIVSPDLVPTAIANNGGTVETVSMTWEEYQDGKTPVPTLDLFRSDGYLFGPAGKFEIWIRNAYMKAHGGQVPDDVFWFAPDKSDKKPAQPVSPAPQPSASSPGDVGAAAGVLGDVDDAFKLF